MMTVLRDDVDAVQAHASKGCRLSNTARDRHKTTLQVGCAFAYPSLIKRLAKSNPLRSLRLRHAPVLRHVFAQLFNKRAAQLGQRFTFVHQIHFFLAQLTVAGDFWVNESFHDLPLVVFVSARHQRPSKGVLSKLTADGLAVSVFLFRARLHCWRVCKSHLNQIKRGNLKPARTASKAKTMRFVRVKQNAVLYPHSLYVYSWATLTMLHCALLFAIG